MKQKVHDKGIAKGREIPIIAAINKCKVSWGEALGMENALRIIEIVSKDFI